MSEKKLTPKDSTLFRQSIGNVLRLKTDIVVPQHPKKPSPYPKNQSLDFEENLISDTRYATENLSLEDSLCYISPGVQKKILKKLRRGHFGLDAKIDLHGLNSREAKHQLLHFLHCCVEDEARCVHIIHGKGYRSPENLPVLKNKLNLWLRQHLDVLAFCSTPPKHGGCGAVYVLLRLTKKYSE